jgi:hypothetical protein
LTQDNPKYEFYEIVVVNTSDPAKAEVNGEAGAVGGRVRCDDGSWYYSVHVYSTNESWCFFEHELLPTGKHARQEDFYDGSSIRVSVDQEGRGEIVCDSEQDEGAGIRDEGEDEKGGRKRGHH